MSGRQQQAAPMAQRLSEAQRRANRRLGWILASVALVFGLGFMAQFIGFGR